MQRVDILTRQAVDLDFAGTREIDKLNPPIFLHPRVSHTRFLPRRLIVVILLVAAVWIRDDGNLTNGLRCRRPRDHRKSIRIQTGSRESIGKTVSGFEKALTV